MSFSFSLSSTEVLRGRASGAVAALAGGALFAQRWARIAASGVIVLVSFGAYSLTIVPLVEPGAQAPPLRAAPHSERKIGRDAVSRQRAALAAWFSDGDWELTTSKILETTRGKLLFKDYENLPDGTVKIWPCTIVLQQLAGSDTGAADAAVILRAPEGAHLRLDKPFDLVRMTKVIPKGGRLPGPITIESRGRSPGPEDDLWIESRDITLVENRATSPYPVQFRWGRTYGSGRALAIELSPTGVQSPAARRSPIEALKSLELRRDVQFYLELADMPLLPKVESSPDGRLPIGASNNGPQPPIEIRCRGPFRFETADLLAIFSDQVDVVRLNPSGASDQLTCQLLKLFFAASGPAGSTEPAAIMPSKLDQVEPRRIEAYGTPVVLRSPEQGVLAQGEILKYDVQSGEASLVGTEQVRLQRASDFIVARELHARRDERGELSEIEAVGQGWLEGANPNEPERRFRARWRDRLHMRPHEGSQVLSVLGDADIEAVSLGSIQAGEIHMWMRDRAQASRGGPIGDGERSGTLNFVPRRMAALGNVMIDSQPVVGAVEKLEIWFHEAEAVPVGARIAASTNANRVHSDTARSAVAPAAKEPRGTPEPPAQKGRLRVEAEQLQAELLVRGQALELSRLMAKNHVRFAEFENPDPLAAPLSVEADFLQIAPAGSAEADCVVQGRPARVEGRGMSLVGGTIKANRGTNRIWLLGAGMLRLPVEQNLEGRALQANGPLEVRWEGQMAFDGRLAQFDRAVTAMLDGRTLHTPRMDVVLASPVDFSAGASGSRPEVEQIVCHTSAQLDSETKTGDQRSSIEQLRCGPLTFWPLTGALEALGPGEITTVRQGTVALMPPAVGGETPQADHQRQNPPSLSYLHVRFQDHARGNMRQRQMLLSGQVEATYGPVSIWDEKVDSDRLGASDVCLNSQTLEVLEMPTPQGAIQSFELTARGDARADGHDFSARGERLSYNQTKDLLELEGDGRASAELIRQTEVGGAPSRVKARRIRFWRTEGSVKIDNAQLLEAAQNGSTHEAFNRLAAAPAPASAR